MTGGRAPKAKGSQFERDVVAVLRDAGHIHAERAYGAGRPTDTGDIDGLPCFAIECKNHKALELAAWMDEAAKEAANINPDVLAVVVVKRRGKATTEAYAVMRLVDWAELTAEVCQ